MRAQRPATPTETRVIGAVASAFGLYFLLIGLGVLPVPGGPRNLHAPLWVVALAGLVFLLGGVAVLINHVAGANQSGELPLDAPRWTQVARYLIGVILFASFALIGSFVAIGGDARQFSGGVPLLGSLNVSIARIMFGFGALICWLATVGFAVSGARKLLHRTGPARSP